MITHRDQDIINLISEDGFHIATTNQIYRLFFQGKSYRYCRKRLEYLCKGLCVIKQTKSTIDNCFAYYIDKKPVQVHHDLLRTELYSHIKNQYTLLEWNNEQGIVNIRPDAIAYIQYNNIPYPVFIEIHLGNKFNFNKYQELLKQSDLKSMFGIMPIVLIYTDRDIKIPSDIIFKLKFKIIDLQMNGLNTLFNIK